MTSLIGLPPDYAGLGQLIIIEAFRIFSSLEDSKFQWLFVPVHSTQS